MNPERWRLLGLAVTGVLVGLAVVWLVGHAPAEHSLPWAP